MVDTFKPDTAEQVVEAVAWALSNETPLEIVGQGTKRGLGRPVKAEAVLDLSGLSGITLYEPQELVLSARAGTPMADIEAALDEAGQMLAFEPFRPDALWGTSGGTIGGVVAANVSGPRRFQAGAARDHMLGFKAVGGRGEAFKSGGRVVKNVTGFDLTKLMAGSMGTLGAMTDVTLKVLPRPEKSRTVLVFGPRDPRQVLIAAQCSPHEISGAAYLPANVAARSGVDLVNSAAGHDVAAIRVEGPGPSVEVRCRELRDLLGGMGAGIEELHTARTLKLWEEIRDVALLDRDQVLWRLSVPPTDGPALAANLAESLGGAYMLDWAGGLVWLAAPSVADANAEAVRSALASGHATLVRAEASVRSAVSAFQPWEGALGALTERVRDSYDPSRIFNPGRMG